MIADPQLCLFCQGCDYHNLLSVLYLSIVVFVCCAVSDTGHLAVAQTVNKQELLLLLLLLYSVFRFNE
jgi:hypothetical protein